MRAIGLSPSIDEIQLMMDDIAPDNEGEIGIEDFMRLMGRKLKETAIEGELKEAYKAFDIDKKGFYTL